MMALVEGSSGSTHTAGSSAASPSCGTGSVSTVAETSSDTTLDTAERAGASVGALSSRGAASAEHAARTTAAPMATTTDGASGRAMPCRDRFCVSRRDMADSLVRRPRLWDVPRPGTRSQVEARSLARAM